MNATSVDMLRAAVSAIWIGLGGIALWCGALCLISSAAGWAGEDTSIMECGGACVMASVLLIGSGAAWFYLLRPRTEPPR